MDAEEPPEPSALPRGRAEGPGHALPDGFPSDAKAKVPKYYPIRSGASYSLRDAAVLLGVPEGTLRRAILMDSIQAQELSDDRQYLIEGKSLLAYVRKLRPEEEIEEERGEGVWWSLAFLALVPLLAAICFLAAGGVRSRSSERPPLPSPGSGIEITAPNR